jgi:copper chaperone CopZ
MITEISIENLKCHGCANTIIKSIKGFVEVSDVTVDIEQHKVIITHTATDVTPFKNKLAQLGYPEWGDNSTLLQVKSYVSCAIGRITKAD